MVSPGQQGGFEVTRAASKGGFYVIHDLGRGGGEGGWEAIFQHLRDILSDLDHSTCRELVTGNTDDLLPKISPEFRSNEVKRRRIVHMRSLAAQQQGQKIHQCGRLSAFAAKRVLIH